MKSLKKANQLMSQIAAANKAITPITRTDFPLFQKFFRREKHTYGNAWSYLVQGMYGIGKNKLGYKYYDGQNLSAVCAYPHLEKPQTHVFYWIRPMGETILDKIANFSQKLLIKLGLPTYVKKIFKEQFNYLKTKGFKDISSFPWHRLAPAEDDTYPERIIAIKKTLLLANQANKNTRLGRAFRYYLSFLKKNTLVFKSIFQYPKETKKILFDFFQYIKQQKKANVSEAPDFYSLLSKPPKLSLIREELMYLHSQPAGFYFLELQDKNFASLYATITRRDLFNHLTEYMMFHILFKLKKMGFSYLNLGGSEIKSLDDFKLKFSPQKENKMYWAVFI